MQSADGKHYKTDVANTKGILRLIHPIPSLKAEPFKLWFAQVGKERIDESADPEIKGSPMLNRQVFCNIRISDL
jgi:hypothetical protein